MKVPIEEDLREICTRIASQASTLEEWAQVESDDMFQAGPFVGGFDADEAEFCFSYYSTDGKEYWFQFSLQEAGRIARGESVDLEARVADD